MLLAKVLRGGYSLYVYVFSRPFGSAHSHSVGLLISSSATLCSLLYTDLNKVIGTYKKKTKKYAHKQL